GAVVGEIAEREVGAGAVIGGWRVPGVLTYAVLVDGAGLEIELAGGVDLHRAVGGADLVGERVGVEQQLGGGGDLDGAVVGEIAEIGRASCREGVGGRELPQVGDDALVEGAGLEVEL